MTAPIIPTDLVYPVRGEDRTDFAVKANTFNQRLVDEVTPQLNAFGQWVTDQGVLIDADVVAAQQSATDSANSAAAALTSENQAQVYASAAQAAAGLPAFSGNAKKELRVKADETGVEYAYESSEDALRKDLLEVAIGSTADVILLESVRTAPMTSYVANISFRFQAAANNTSGVVTLNIDGVGALPIANISSPNQIVAGNEYSVRITPDLTSFALGVGGGGGATGGGTDQLFYESDQAMTADYTITGKNALLAGPLVVDDSVTLVVDDGSRLVVV